MSGVDTSFIEGDPSWCRPRRSSRVAQDHDLGAAPGAKRASQDADSLPTTRDSSTNAPLLLAPPLSQWGRVKHNLRTVTERLNELGEDLILQPMFPRILLFLLKILTLSWSCRPYAFNLTAGLPLILLAISDLTMATYPLHPRSSRSYYNTAMNWVQTHIFSLLLFVVHMLLIWAMAHFSILCPPPLLDVRIPW